jgi:hypothetical protein
MKICRTNHDPKIIYLEVVKKSAGCPHILRSDHGTENSVMAAIHIALKPSHEPDAAVMFYLSAFKKKCCE